MAIKIFSYGGGVQSTAVLLAHIQGLVHFDHFVYSDVGMDSENPETIAYMIQHIAPLIEKYNIPFEVTHKTRKGIQDTVYKSVMRMNRSVPIPVWLASGAYGYRSCTSDFKVKVVDKWVKSRYRNQDIDMGLGFSTDEMRRVITKPKGYNDAHGKYKYGYNKQFVFPLIELGFSRHDCHALIESFGLPEAPPSACWFCPFKSRQAWRELRRKRPDLYNEAINIEDTCNAKRGYIGKNRVTIHRDGSLRDIPEQMTMLDVFFDDMDCDSGYCGL